MTPSPALWAHAEHTAGDGLLAWLVPVLVVTVPGLAHAVAVGRWTERGRAWPVHRTLALLAGLLVVAWALSPTVDTLAHDDPRWHMVQHLALGMVAPVGLVLSAPVTLLLGASSPTTRRVLASLLSARPLHVLGHPLTAALLVTGSLYVLYLTPLHALSTRNDLVHHLLHVHFVVSGHLFTWSLVGPDPAPHRPGMTHRLVALVLAAGGHAHLAKLLYARADAGVVPAAGDDPALWQQAAQWMYYGGDVVEVAVLVVLLTAWYRHGRAPGARRAPAPPPRSRAAGGLPVRWHRGADVPGG